MTVWWIKNKGFESSNIKSYIIKFIKGRLYVLSRKNSIGSQSGTVYSSNRHHYIQNPLPRPTSLPKKSIHPYTSSRNTRRSTPKFKFHHTPTFECRVHKSVKHFSNSFSHYAPVLWNSFPFQIRNSPSVASFRKRIKTHLFNSSFPT